MTIIWEKGYEYKAESFMDLVREMMSRGRDDHVDAILLARNVLIELEDGSFRVIKDADNGLKDTIGRVCSFFYNVEVYHGVERAARNGVDTTGSL